MTHRIIFFMPRFNRYSHLFIFFRLLSLQIQRSSRQAERAGHLRFGVGAIGLTQLKCYFYLFHRFYLPNSPEAFFRIPFWTVNSPMIFFNSSGDSPSAYP